MEFPPAGQLSYWIPWNTEVCGRSLRTKALLKKSNKLFPLLLTQITSCFQKKHSPLVVTDFHQSN